MSHGFWQITSKLKHSWVLWTLWVQWVIVLMTLWGFQCKASSSTDSPRDSHPCSHLPMIALVTCGSLSESRRSYNSGWAQASTWMVEECFSTFIFSFLRFYNFVFLFLILHNVLKLPSLPGVNSLHTKRRLAGNVAHSYNLSSEIKASLGYIARPWLTKTKQKGDWNFSVQIKIVNMVPMASDTAHCSTSMNPESTLWKWINTAVPR